MRRAFWLVSLLGGCVSPEQARQDPAPMPDAHPIAAVPAVPEPPAEAEPEAEPVPESPVRSPVKLDEEVILFPAPAWQDPKTDAWQVPIHGWIYEPEEGDAARSTLMMALRELLGDDPRFSKPPFEDRVRPFLWDNERGKVVPVEVGGIVVQADPSEANGHFRALARLPADVALRVAEQRAGRSPPPILRLRAITPTGDDRRFEVATLLVARTGLTVVSDVDDTVKITQVRDHRAMLENTFFEPFRAVPGMSTTYARWLLEADGGHLHFVSSSPWQLYPTLRRMLDDAGFPDATFELKSIRLSDSSVADLFADPMRTKGEAIAGLIERFPERHFALVGDSGEKDPEVYGEVARAHPERVVYIAIRDVTGEGIDAPRYADAFAGVKAPWEVFTDPATLTGPPH